MWLLPRPLRLHYFMEISRQMTDAEYWRLLAQIWIDTEGPSYNRSVWLHLFACRRSEKHHLMNTEEHSAFAALPELVRIYRGAPPKRKQGMSWTTSLDQARWFARRFCNGGVVFTTTVPKTKVLAQFLGREESEVVIDPRRIRIEELPDGCGEEQR